MNSNQIFSELVTSRHLLTVVKPIKLVTSRHLLNTLRIASCTCSLFCRFATLIEQVMKKSPAQSQEITSSIKISIKFPLSLKLYYQLQKL